MLYYSAGDTDRTQGLEVGKGNGVRKGNMRLEAEGAENDGFDMKELESGGLVFALGQNTAIGGLCRGPAWIHEP